MHAPIALAAMDLNKHVYVQKPLTWSIDESRRLARRAKELKIATQMGNQGHSLDDARKTVECIRGGAIGQVREIHVWTNRPLGFWPQGVPRPEALKVPADTLPWNGQGVTARLANAFAGSYPVPDALAWDLFLGVGPHVEYHPIYHPFNWRGWVDWGVGAIGDMGAHLIDHSMWALEPWVSRRLSRRCRRPSTARLSSGDANVLRIPGARQNAAHEDDVVRRRVACRRKPQEIGEEELNKGGGVLLVGSKGKLMHDTYGLKPRLLPHRCTLRMANRRRTATHPGEDHEMNWVDAAKGKAKRPARLNMPRG